MSGQRPSVEPNVPCDGRFTFVRPDRPPIFDAFILIGSLDGMHHPSSRRATNSLVYALTY